MLATWQAAWYVVILLNYHKESPLSAFHDAIQEIVAMHDRKAHDYGIEGDPLANVRAAEHFGITPWLGAILRMNDKIARIKSFCTRGNLLNESLEDSLLDIAVYAVIALVLYRESEAKARHDNPQG